MSSESLLSESLLPDAQLDESISSPVREETAGVMGATHVVARSACSAWQCQFDALVRKNLHQLQSRIASLLVILLAPAGGGLLVELMRGQVQKYAGDGGDVAAGQLGGLIVSVAVTLTTLVYYQQLCGEKQRGLTGAMRLAGLSESAYWASYLVLYTVMSVLGGIVFELLAMPTRVPMFVDTHTGVMAFIIFVYLMSMTSLASFWSSFSQRPIVVNLLSFFLFSVVGISCLLYGQSLRQLDLWLAPPSSVVPMLFVGLMPWLSFIRVWLIVVQKTAPLGPDPGSTFKWGSLMERELYCVEQSVDPECVGVPTLPGLDENWRAPPALFSLGIMVAAMPVYFLLAWYTSQAFGGEMRQSVIFPFLPAYWGCEKQQSTAAMGDTVAKEQILSRREKSIRCAKLSKAYDQVTALKELSLKMEPNAITCLLGHNGAGKSTLIHTLTGLVNATFGDAFVMGMSVRDQMADIQKVMGICPQHDKLWDELTAEQHLLFYARFKGMERSELREYVAAALKQFGLEAEGSDTVGTFSGGMKRRVSVAVAAMANPSVVYLDEPTTGMDPLHRRQVWDMVQQLRANRIIVLTTHSMEEADSLGDQIAIMASGKLRALGSSIFLKQKFGRGFQVGLISRPEDSPEVERLVDKLLPGAETVSAAAGNIAISLGKRLLSRVPDFFRALEDGELSKYVNEWSLSNTRLEEVFLRLCAGNTEVNAGGTGDSGTLTFDDLSSLTASEAIDVINELAWTAERVKSSIDAAQMAVPSFSTDDGYRVLAGLAGGEIALGNVAVDERTKIARDKTIGTIAKPLIAKAIDDGRGTLSVVLPATGLPAAKLCVQVPDLRKIFIEVPMDGTVGEEIFFTAPPPLAQSTSTSIAGGVQMEGDELFRSLREPAHISTFKQTWALVAKQASLQSRQKKSNCCQCCIFFTLVLFGLFTLAPMVDPGARRALLSTPAFEYRLVNGSSTGEKDGWISDFVETAAPALPNGFLHNFTEVSDAHRRLQAVDPELTLVSPVVFMFCMGTMLHMPKFVYQLIEEKQQRLYHSMRLQGLSLVAYWLGIYVYDFLLYGSFTTVFIGLGYIFKIERFMHANAIRWILASLVFGHSQIGMAVFASSIVRSPKLATVLFYLIIVSSCIAAIVINSFIPVNWSPFLLMVPTLAYPRSIALILAQGGGFAIGAGSELGRALWIQALMGTALFAVGVFLHMVLPNEFGMTESHLVTQFCARLNKTNGPVSLTGDAASRQRSKHGDLLVQHHGGTESGFTVGSESAIDPNVAAEASRIKRGAVDPTSCPILINELGLVYLPGLWTQFVSALKRLLCGERRRAPKQAVDAVSLAIPKGELFGLLGPNGAGKTSVVNILSGLIVQSEGDCHVGSFNTSSEMALVHTILGVCPQFDTVWAELTVEEHLILYARLKGVASTDQRGLVQSVAEAIQLDGDPLRQPASQLSGGMLRRLSLGIALIANPQVVLLDEPTTGLDPETRRMVWDIIEKERTKGRCIVLTTHSMEEADTLCTRIGIMAQGKMRSLGSSTELKTRHGQGYRLSFTLKKVGSDVDEALLRNELCPTATLIYSFNKSRVYLLPTEDTHLGSLFDKLVNMKESLGVREWGLSQATLEEAFIRICEEAGTK